MTGALCRIEVVDAMQVELKMRLDTAALNAQLNREGGKWADAVNHTMADMARRAPTKVGKIGAETYNIAATRLNPRNKRAKGFVSLQGGINDLTLVYVGQKLPVTDFKGVKPRGYRKRPYQITGEIVKGQAAKLGHWNKPHSEGGRYSGNSPWFYVNKKKVKAPVMRLGSKLGDGMKALAIPQMVVSERSEGRVVDTLTQLLDERLTHNLARAGLS